MCLAMSSLCRVLRTWLQLVSRTLSGLMYIKDFVDVAGFIVEMVGRRTKAISVTFCTPPSTTHAFCCRLHPVYNFKYISLCLLLLDGFCSMAAVPLIEEFVNGPLFQLLLGDNVGWDWRLGVIAQSVWSGTTLPQCCVFEGCPKLCCVCCRFWFLARKFSALTSPRKMLCVHGNPWKVIKSMQENFLKFRKRFVHSTVE